VPPARKINYNLLFFSAEDLACCNPKAGYLILGDDIPWEDFYAHMKIKACDQLFPNQPVVHNNSFDMNFAIARHVPIPLSLTSAADYAHLTNASKIKKNPTIKVSLTSHTPNLVRELSEFVFMQWYDEYHLQEPGKENIATAVAPAQDNGRPELKGPAEKKKKSRVCIVLSMFWIICIPLPFARHHEKQIFSLPTLQSTARYALSGNSGNAMLHRVNQISALYLQKGCISLSGMAILRSGQQQL
jgi:hypothetical protein